MTTIDRSAGASALGGARTRLAPGVFRRGVWGLVVLGVVQQVLLLRHGLEHNPYLRLPVLDAAHFWEWSGRIAGGEVVGEAPFFSAPLYPYLVGMLRALGADRHGGSRAHPR